MAQKLNRRCSVEMKLPGKEPWVIPLSIPGSLFLGLKMKSNKERTIFAAKALQDFSPHH